MKQEKNLLSAFQNSLWKKTLTGEIKLMSLLPVTSDYYHTMIIIWNIQISACMKEKTLAILTTMFERTKALKADNLWFSSD